MGVPRSYEDPCGIARALDRVGERWALLVVRELLLGPKRFTDLRAGLPGLSPDVLSQRLRELEAEGLIDRLVVPTTPVLITYQPSERAVGLMRALHPLVKWSIDEQASPR